MLDRMTFRLAVLDGTLKKEHVADIFMDFAASLNKSVGGSTRTLDIYPLDTPMAELSEMSDAADRKRYLEGLTPVLKQHGGLGVFKRSTGGNYQIVFHWPSFFMTGFTNPSSRQARVVWLLQALVRRRSPLLFALLRRKYLTETGVFDTDVPVADGRFKEEAFADVLPINAEEVSLCESLGERVVSVPEFGSLAHYAFTSLFTSSKLDRAQGYRALKKWKNICEGTPFLMETGVVPLRRINMLHEFLRSGANVEAPDIATPPAGYGAPGWSEGLFDVLVLPHYSTPNGRFGVYKVKLGDRDVPHFVVNVPMIMKQLAREDRFSKIGELWRTKSEKMSAESLRDKVVLSWGVQLPMLIQNEMRAKVDVSNVWPVTSPGDIYVMPLHLFEQLRKHTVSMFKMRKHILPENRAKKLRVAGFRKIIQLSSPGISQAGGASFQFRAIYRGNSVAISPAWEKDFEEEFFQNRNYKRDGAGELVLREGIYLNAATREYYYSLGRYLSYEGTPTAEYTQLREWLRTLLEDMTRDQFAFMLQAAKRNPTNEVHVPRGAAKRAILPGKLFTDEADKIIIHHLRPGKMVDVLVALERIRQPKDKREVSQRAFLLREKLIAEGVYDMDELPHTNYSATLGKRLKKLKDAKVKHYADSAVSPK